MAPPASVVVCALAWGVVSCGNRSRLDPLFAAPTIAIDGAWTEPAWNLDAQRGVFMAGSAIARPWSEVRILHDADHVFIALYAADEDIEPTDAFELTIDGHTLRLGADGSVIPAGVHVAVDRDGTLGQPADDDEEWVVELEVSRAGMGASVPISARRCDRPKDGLERCGQWDGVARLSP